jgi:quercetin dioxygenase-like cupin family protein
MGTHRITDWPDAPDAMSAGFKDEFAAHAGDGRVGNVLLSETERVRVWSISLEPGDRLGFHTHVLDYFWTSVTGGKGRSHFDDGRVAETAYEPGGVAQLTFQQGEFMIHDLENIGDTVLLFTTVEFLDSPNAPLVLRSHTR